MKITEEKQPSDEEPSNGTGNGAATQGTFNSLASHVMEQSMYGAIDAVMANAEQSYDEFMQSFIFLTPDDVGCNSSLSRGITIPASLNTNSSLRKELSKTHAHVNVTDHLDEEVLGAGTTSSDSHGETVGKLRRLKIDNFVDDETSSLSDSDEGLGDDGLEYAGYQASFSDENPTNKNGQSNSIKTPGCEQYCDSPRNSARADEKTKMSTASPPLDVSTVSDDQGSDTHSELLYDPRLDRLNPGEVDTDVEIRHVTDVNHRRMGYSARPAETLQRKEATYLPEVDCDTGEDTTEVSDCTCSVIQKSDDVITYEAVEPFVLDEDFDYDNVILTPKYSAEEMDQIMRLLEQGPVYVPPPSPGAGNL